MSLSKPDISNDASIRSRKYCFVYFGFSDCNSTFTPPPQKKKKQKQKKKTKKKKKSANL